MKKYSSSSGFTLIEALLAIFIFSMALVSLITITSRGITGTAQARDQAIAQFLAQEGIEVVRNIRDANIVQGQNWLTGIDICATQNNPCALEFDGTSYVLSQTSSTGLEVQSNQYVPVSPTGAKFERLVYYNGTINANEIEVHSVVRWQTGMIPREIDLVTTLTAWSQI